MRRSAAETREHVLKVAHELFYWHGIRATGVDRISAEAGVAPMTLYRLFPSKDDLVAAYLERAHRLYLEWFDAAVDRGGADPKARVLALFDALIDQTHPSQCRGCPFLMALAEIPDRDHSGHQHAVRTKQWVHTRMRELAAAVTAEDPAMLADHLVLLMEGVYASAQALGTTGPAERARALVARLLATA